MTILLTLICNFLILKKIEFRKNITLKLLNKLLPLINVSDLKNKINAPGERIYGRTFLHFSRINETKEIMIFQF